MLPASAPESGDDQGREQMAGGRGGEDAEPFDRRRQDGRVGVGEQPIDGLTCTAFAQIKIGVEGEMAITAGEGDGPVHALDVALRKALERFYPGVHSIRLTDFKVRVLDSKSATAAKVRVLIESTENPEDS